MIIPKSKAEIVDAAVWGWIKSLLTEPEKLSEGLQVYKAEKEKNVVPLRERLKLVMEMLEPERQKLSRLLDLYLSGEFTKDMLTDRKTRLETRIHALEKEKLELEAQLDEQTLSEEQIQIVQRFGQEIANEVDFSDENRETMLYIINILNVQVKLGCAEDEQYAEIQCGIGEKQLLSLTRTATYARQSPTSRHHRGQP